MQFDPELTRRVRDLILERGRALPEQPQSPLSSVEPPACTPELRAILHRVAPMAEALYLMVNADGVCDESEHRALRGAVRTLTGDALEDRTIEAMFASFRNSLAGDGIDGRVSYVARQIAADHADSKVTLELAAAAILSDGPAAPAERAALEQLAEELGADPDAALAMLD